MSNLKLKSRHRLLCGDSTNEMDVHKLMDNAKADLCFTSPPYGLGKAISLRGNTTLSKTNQAYDEHDDNPIHWRQLMDDWFEQSKRAVSKVVIVNVQMLAGNKRELMQWIADNNEFLVDIAIWDKGHGAPHIQQGVLASRHEFLCVFASENATRAIPCSSWQGTIQSVYEGGGQRNNENANIHGATMPVHLPVWIMEKLCDQSQSVYEPFCGTGTTLIAAEQLNRKCYALEISARYCDVIVARWEALTNQKAVLHV